MQPTLRIATGRLPAPVTAGIPWPRGALRDPSRLALYSPGGESVPLQTRVLDLWSDGSVRWLLLDWIATAPAGWTLAPGERPAPPEEGRVLAFERAGGVALDTGAVRFELPRGDPIPGRGRLRLIDARGGLHEPRFESVAVEESGPVRAAILACGRIGPLDLSVRFHAFAGSAAVRLEVEVTNPRGARHPGGIWDLGDPGSILFEELSIEFPLGGAEIAELEASVEPGLPLESFGLPFELHQESSGGDGWAGPNHVNRKGDVPLAFRGYRIRAGGEERRGRRALPIVSLARAGRRLAVAFDRFWQEFPRAVVATDPGLAVGLFPAQAADLHELQGGERKTHVFHVAFGDEPLERVRDPAVARAEPEWYAASGALPHLVPRAADDRSNFHDLADEGVDGPERFEAKREGADEYGWRHFGDLPADHEAVFHEGREPFPSHYNNQYDAVAGFACRFLSTGDRRWWRLMDDLARHVADIDVYHTDLDKAAYAHGLFWHTAHHVDAGRSTHRSYPSGRGLPGGGPSCEHAYSGGLLLHHYLTGSAASRQAAIELGRWIVQMDEGRRTVFRWVAPRPTGLASATANPLYHGPGRGAANAIQVLLDAHRLTGVEFYRSKAEEILRRTIHPADDVPARNLLDAERRWSYTVYLQMLGRLLDDLAEKGELGELYAYARESLLAYARWMAEHEVPYLDRPEVLEFPNETWAAQDLRKAEVFAHAARHATGPEQGRFLERERFFFEDATRRLAAMPTRTFTRPMVLVLTQGWRRVRGQAPVPERAFDFGRPPPPFVPQKEAAKRRVAALLAAGALFVAGALLVL